MEWQHIKEFTQDEVTGLAVVDGTSLVAATSGGELFRLTVDGVVTLLERTDRRLNSVSRIGGGWGCVGAGGFLFTIIGGRKHLETVDAELELTGFAENDLGELCVVGKRGAHSGAAFRRGTNSESWTIVPHIAGNTSRDAVAMVDATRFIVVGYQGLAELIEPSGAKLIPTATTHPLRAVCVVSVDQWYVGGGGWAQEMPILLEGNDEGFRPLVWARGNRAIMGIARDALGGIWVAENQSDGRQWNGIVSRLQGNELVRIAEFPSQRLSGIVSHERVLAVHGSVGLVAWASLT